MKRIAILVTLLLFFGAGWYGWRRFAGLTHASSVLKPRAAPSVEVGQEDLAQFLAEAVTADGFVDYTAAKASRHLLERYLDRVAKATPANYADDQARLAFLINAYNACVIEGVLHYWPLRSVTEAGPFRLFFRERRYLVAGERVSLHGLETEVLRKFDARMHFALNCASASCPVLWSQPYDGLQLDRQLDERARLFINDKTRNYFDEPTNTWHLSQVFAWYADDFGGEPGVRRMLKKYAAFSFPEDHQIVYISYDWNLNAVH